jgi:hypothetical protein
MGKLEMKNNKPSEGRKTQDTRELLVEILDGNTTVAETFLIYLNILVNAELILRENLKYFLENIQRQKKERVYSDTTEVQEALERFLAGITIVTKKLTDAALYTKEHQQELLPKLKDVNSNFYNKTAIDMLRHFTQNVGLVAMDMLIQSIFGENIFSNEEMRIDLDFFSELREMQ